MEMKIKIANLKRMTAHLNTLGAKFDKEIGVRDTYFNQPRGEVLKLSETDEGDFIVHLKSRAGGFDYLQDEKVNDVDKLKEELKEKFGIKSVLNKKRQFYGYKNYILDINTIEGLGNFLVVLGDKITKRTITNELQIKNPKIIKIPFDELPKKRRQRRG